MVDYCLCYFVLEGEWKKKGRDFIRPKTKAKPEAFSEAFPFLIFWQQCVCDLCNVMVFSDSACFRQKKYSF